MDVRYSEEQVALRDSAVQLAQRLAPHTVAEIDQNERAMKLHAAVESAGWREFRTATEDGSAWGSGVEVALVAEELGRRLADTSFLGPTLAAEFRRLAGAPAASEQETVAFAGGLGDAAVARGGLVPPDAVALDAQGATTAVLLVPDGDRFSLGRATIGSVRQDVDLTRPAFHFSASAPVIALEGQRRPVSPDDLARWRCLGLAATCADLVGAMRGALDLACDYARTRRQYGATIGSFQAVQHLLADALVSVEGSRSIALHAAWAVDALDGPEALKAAVMAKAYCSRAARNVCETAIQIHGGIGNTWDCLAHVYLRRVLVSAEILGGVGTSLDQVLAAHGIGSDHGLR
jgi:alkylation response protein AidB-like acyl-CoA dehydrogenase